MARALGDHVLVGVAEQLQLAAPAHHRRVGPPSETGSVRHDREQSADGERLRLPLRDQGCDVLDPDGVADESIGRLTEQDLARLSALLEPRGDVHRVACREPLLRAGHHLTRVDADAELELDAVVPSEPAVQLGDPVPHLGRGSHGAERVVFVHHRNAEDGHHRVADELLHRAAVPLDHRLHRLEVACHHPAQRLGIELLAQRRRPGHVAENDRHRLALLTRGRCYDDPGATIVAERGALTVLGTALHADDHRRESTTARPAALPHPPLERPQRGAHSSGFHPLIAGMFEASQASSWA